MTTPPRLRIVNDDSACIVTPASDNDGMLGFLEEPGGHFMTPRIGREVLAFRRPAAGHVIDVTRGETYHFPGGWSTTGGRYLMRDDSSGRIVGALNYTMRRGAGPLQVVLSNLAVAKDCRRQGIATRLVEELVSDHPGVRADSSMTDDGAAFMGYAPPAQTKPTTSTIRKPRP